MKRSYVIFFIVLISVFGLSSCGKNNSINLEPNKISTICEMAVLKCYYHNTAEIMKNGKRQWLDYESTIKLGIDGKNLKIDIIDSIVNISIPKIKIMDEPEVNFEAMRILTDQTGILKTKFTNDERLEAISIVSEDVITSVQNNSQLIQNAETRVKRIIESYINQVAELTGKTYTIQWKMLEEA